MRLLVAALCVAVAAAGAATARYEIRGQVQLPGHISIPATAPVFLTLNGGQHLTQVRADGSFVFPDVAPGAHLLEVSCTELTFRPVRVDISVRHSGKIKARYADGSRAPLAYPLVLAPERRTQYYEIREPFNLMAMLSSPMVLMALFTVAMLFVMPKMMDGMDPEQLKQFQKAQGNPAAMYRMAQEEAAKQEAQAAAQQQQQQGRR